MKIYTGKRNEQGELEVLVNGWILQPRSDLNNSFIGLNRSATQLSLALCADALQDDSRAKKLCKDFKLKVMDNLPRNNWTLTHQQVLDAIYELESDR
jgi:hypothetical protein